MNDQKRENMLNLALDATEEERARSLQLNVGFQPALQRWEVIVLYQGDLSVLDAYDTKITYLLGGYAILDIPAANINAVTALPQITYMEKPKRLFFAVNQGKAASCINPVQIGKTGLFGRGVLVACIDSGVDYTHPDFRNPDGSSRILALWDQSIPGNPPSGYQIGTLYTKSQLDEALRSPGQERALVPSMDFSGHGTAVLGIAAGNGAAGGGRNRGVAPESTLLVVKLGIPSPEGFPRTTQLMQAVDFVVRTAMELKMPLAINLSFGNSYGSHSGDSLLETYLDTVANLGQSVICIGTGNEGAAAGHTSGTLTLTRPAEIELGVGTYEASLNLQIWKFYVDNFDIELIHPSGARIGPLSQKLGTVRFTLGQTELLIFYGMPSPYSIAQEVYLDFIPLAGRSYIDSGVWTIRLIPRRIVEGEYHMWLPGGNSIGAATRFYQPTPETTLTIPSAARSALTVGAYNSALQAYAPFSGRGFTRVLHAVKPDIAAPGVNIQSTRAGGGYGIFTGTSFATPFVTGSAALMMEWGILKGNDPFLYGEKVKAQLIRGAHEIPGESEYPNPRLGYGVLCLRDSLSR